MTPGVGSPTVVTQLIDATREVFETMLNTSLTIGVPIEGDALRPRSNIVATVSFAGPDSGLVAFYTTSGAAAQIAAGLVGNPVDQQEEIADAIGEVANMIAGTFRNYLAQDGNGWAISIPSVTIGSDFYTRYVSDVRRVLCPFRVWDEEVFVELILTQGRHGHRH